MVAFGQGLSGLFVDDEVMKGSLASYTFGTGPLIGPRAVVPLEGVEGPDWAQSSHSFP